MGKKNKNKLQFDCGSELPEHVNSPCNSPSQYGRIQRVMVDSFSNVYAVDPVTGLPGENLGKATELPSFGAITKTVSDAIR